MSTQPPPPPGEEWPTTEQTAVSHETVPAGPPPPPEEPASRIGWGLLIGILVLALVAAGILAVWLVTRHHHHKQATTVTVTTAPTTTAAPKVAVPDVKGLKVDQAVAKLDALGLNSTQTQVTSTDPAGTVVDQAPPAGDRLAKGSTVTLNVAKGAPTATGTTTATTTAATTTTAQPATATVPDLSGQQLQGAAAQLGQAGLLASVQYVPGSDPLETVEAQSPTAGKTVKARSHVTVNVSSGPGQKPEKTVPNVVGQTLDQAVSTIKAAGLRVVFLKVPVATRTQAGRVVEQTPAAGKTAPQNAQVLIYLGAFRP